MKKAVWIAFGAAIVGVIGADKTKEKAPDKDHR